MFKATLFNYLLHTCITKNYDHLMVSLRNGQLILINYRIMLSNPIHIGLVPSLLSILSRSSISLSQYLYMKKYHTHFGFMAIPNISALRSAKLAFLRHLIRPQNFLYLFWNRPVTVALEDLDLLLTVVARLLRLCVDLSGNFQWISLSPHRTICWLSNSIKCSSERR